MSEKLQALQNDTKAKMNAAIKHLEESLVKIKAGKANAHMLDGLFVECYGANTPISQVANINTPDAKTISIQPWDRSLIHAIEKAIINSNLGLAPDNNGEYIRLNIPPVTEERRRDLVKRVKVEGENAHVSVRTIRHAANDVMKKLKAEAVSEDLIKKCEIEIQKLTDDFNKKINDICIEKEKEILKV